MRGCVGYGWQVCQHLSERQLIALVACEAMAADWMGYSHNLII